MLSDRRMDERGLGDLESLRGREQRKLERRPLQEEPRGLPAPMHTVELDDRTV